MFVVCVSFSLLHDNFICWVRYCCEDQEDVADYCKENIHNSQGYLVFYCSDRCVNALNEKEYGEDYLIWVPRAFGPVAAFSLFWGFRSSNFHHFKVGTKSGT